MTTDQVWFHITVSSDDENDETICDLLTEYKDKADKFYKDMMVKHPDSMNIEYEMVLVDEDNFPDDCIKLIAGYGPYHFAANWEEIQMERQKKKN